MSATSTATTSRVKRMQLAQGKALVLRTCKSDMSSQNGFVWPAVGEVAEAADWQPTSECGAGLHGWLYGHGDHLCSSYLDETAKWLVVEVDESAIIMLGGKCKFPRGKVVFAGGKKEATDFLIDREPRARNAAVIGASLVVGYKECVTVGALGTATAGDRGTATAGYRGTATAGYGGTATAGNRGTATAGYGGTATAGYGGTATAGYGGTATAGYRGEIRIRHWDAKAERYRTKIGYIGEDGLEENVAYRLDAAAKFVRADVGVEA